MKILITGGGSWVESGDHLLSYDDVLVIDNIDQPKRPISRRRPA